MPSIPFYLRAGIVCLLACGPLQAQLPVRNAVSPEGLPLRMADGIPDTGWESTFPGSTASLLLDDPLWLEARVILADRAEAPFQFLASRNYRDWTLAGAGYGESLSAETEPVPVVPGEALYLRLQSGSPEPVSWELLTGSQAAVEQQLTALKPVDWGDITDPSVILGMVELAFDWQVDNQTTRQDAIGWVNGAFHTGVSALYAATGQEKYRQAIVEKGESVNWTLRERTTGKAFYHADDHCIGQSWLELYIWDPEPQASWIIDVKRRLDRVMADPIAGRDDFNWCDALYMSPPVYVRLAEVTNNDAYRSFIDLQWWDATDFLYDTEYHLFYRDASYFDDREPNGMPVFWSRGNGWVVGGLVRMLQYMPADWPTRPQYITLLEEMSAALAAIQGDDGLWSSSLLYPEKYDYERETSGSAFFTYAMAWGINEGILDEGIYGPVVENAWAGLADMLNANGTIAFIQQIGAGPAANDGQFLDKDYGYGAYILAGLEMITYYANRTPALVGARSAASPASPARPLSGDPADWTLVDDFENSFTWTEAKDVPYSAIPAPDPHDPGGSTVLSLYTGERTAGYYRATSPIPAIPDGSVATVYQRFAFDNPEIDVLFGISDLSLVDAYPDYENGLRIYFDYNVLEARSGGTYVPIAEDFLQLETWYEAWTVIDNASDTYDVYLRGGSNFPQLTLLASGIPFRNGTSSSIISYALSYNSQYCEGTFFLDDLHVDTSGINLSRPVAVRQPAYSPWSAIGRNPVSGWKAAPIGTIWDDLFPWIYHLELQQWCHIHAMEVYPGGYWGWLATSGSWAWFSADWPGWFYHYTDNQWWYLGNLAQEYL